MIDIKTHVELQPFNTLAIPSIARYYTALTDIEQIPEILRQADSRNTEIRVLGGGSNLILASELNCLVVHNCLQGREVVAEDELHLYVRVMAGENWHELVRWTVDQNWSGIENLALIPGTVGACPVQNIGAYGVEVQSVIQSVEAVDLITGQVSRFDNQQCQFSYRDSIFKQQENNYLITAVTLKLNKKFTPVLNYGPLEVLSEHGNLSPRDVFDRVCQIRLEKLPDPNLIPNAGSFFKNPIIEPELLPPLLEKYPDLVHFPANEKVKLAAGWLIDRAGLKGQANDAGVGCYGKQALVLVNPLKAPTEQILGWSEQVVTIVAQKFGVKLEAEPRFWQ